jgi:hypothetical protein
MSGINDLDLKNWKKHGDVWTDSLWMIDERDKSGGHVGDYHGNFVPQIPHQLIQRFTKKGGVVLDPFLGSGTTLIEARRMGRNGIGIELLPDIAKLADSRLDQTSLLEKTSPQKQIVIQADSTTAAAKNKVEAALKELKKTDLQLIILHPPYHDIIKFSDNPKDLSNATTVEDFTKQFGKVVNNFLGLLKPKHYLAVVIGDKYTGGEWVPLSWLTMDEILRNQDVILKSVVVKNMVNNRAKRNAENLWRYRALAGGFYIFKHEYILLFQKK